jgi:cytochrome c-type biogenesis protein CcmH
MPSVMTLRRLPALLTVFFLAATPLTAAPDLDEEARAIEAQLIAPCCFTQTVDVHESEAALEVRRDVRARLEAGQTKQQILDAYVAAYGTHILASPPARGFDLALYLVPLFVMALTLFGLGVVLRRYEERAIVAPAEPATAAPDAEARLDEELRDLD